MTDAELEAKIEACRARAMAAKAPDEKRAAFADMAELVKKRSPEQIAKMERERHLA